MDKQKTLAILEALANGADPITGEAFPSDSTYQNADVVRALFYAIDAIKKSKEIPKKDLPVNSGRSWTPQEDKQLQDAFLKDKKDMPELAALHQRTVSSIKQRLFQYRLIDRYGKRIAFLSMQK